MGKRPNRRIFKRRRQRAGYALLVSFAVVVVGVVLFSSLNPPSTNLTAASSTDKAVQRVASPSMERGAPEPVSEDVAAAETAEEQAAKKDAPAESSGDGSGDEAKEDQKEPEQASGPPPIPEPATNDLWMDVPALGLNDNYIANTESHAAMDAGAIKLPSTGFPWQDNANTYIAAHRLGWPGTASDHQFYNLPNLALGDKIYLYDANGTVYTYEVSGFAEVLPNETWITSPKSGRDMISLQTCIEDYGDYWTEGPNWYVRYVVQADRVSVDRA